MRGRRALVILAFGLAVLGLTAGTQGSSDGRGDRAALGCSGDGCHGIGPDADVTPALTGLPEVYTPGETYVLNITIEGGREPLPATTYAGGFALGASDGAISVLPGDESVKVGETRNATHTQAGATQRAWTVVWTAPPPTGGTVMFDLSVNAVNGNHAPDPLDQWSHTQFLSEEGEAPPPPQRSGPNTNNTQSTSAPPGGSGTPAPGAVAAVAAAAAAARLAGRRMRDSLK